MSASGCPCRASVLSYFHLCLSRLVFPCPVTGVLVGCSTSWQKGSLRPIAPNRCICLHGCGPFSPLQTGRLVPARDRCVGSLRCRNRPECRSSWFVCRRSRHASFGFRLVRSWGIVNAYLYMVAAGCQGRQAIAVRCIDMSQRADAVPVYPESTGLCTFHEEYQAFPFHLYGNFNIFFIFYDAGVGISPCQLGGYIGGMPAVSQLVFIRRTGQCAVP